MSEYQTLSGAKRATLRHNRRLQGFDRETAVVIFRQTQEIAVSTLRSLPIGMWKVHGVVGRCTNRVATDGLEFR